MPGELVAEIQRTDGTWAEIRRQGAGARFLVAERPIRWTCNCEGERGGVCRHLRALWSGQVTEDPARAGMFTVENNPNRRGAGTRKRRYLVRVTELGGEILRERWAALALGK